MNSYRLDCQTKQVSLLPVPSTIDYSDGTFNLNNQTKVVLSVSDEKANGVAQYLVEQVKFLSGISINIDTKTKEISNSIILRLDYTSQNKEAYTLKVESNGIEINASSVSGLFYGVQTLLQMVYPGEVINNSVTLTCAEVKDEPSFSWRGMHLDVSRHFYSVTFIKKMLDVMATLKLNTFHWHLTDDQGWRIEIKKYPKLTEVGSWRKETMEGHYVEIDQKFDNMRYGGYYTQDEIREVVNYAQSRFIRVVPEIEMPGHAVAALSAYPQYSCTGGPFEVYTKWGVSDDVFCAGKEETFGFLEDILSEVIDLFPGEYIHIGGDECPKLRWKECSLCQKRIVDEHLKNELELQSYFIKRIEKFIASKGKKLIGWDEILEGGLPERATVMSWRGYEGGIEAAHSGHDVVMTPGSHCYFDHLQGEPENEPLAFGGFTSLEKVYSFDPVPPALSAEGSKHVLGAQANVWTEYITNENKAEYMIFPRLCAMAEVLWSDKSTRNYNDFLIRMDSESVRLQKYRVNYRPNK
jgi:hexosaminidase